MPQEIVTIPVTGAAPFEAASTLLSYVAYAHADDRSQRQKFAAALTRYKHVTASHSNHEWGRSLQQIRPYIFSDEQKIYERNLRQGMQRLNYRLPAASLMLLAHLDKFAQPGKLRVHPHNVGGLDPSVENICFLLKADFGLKGENVSNFKSKVWGPTRPVCHVALVLTLHGILSFPRSHRSGASIPLEFLFPPADALPALLRTAEAYRVLLPSISQFRIKEERTIKFISS
jgi:hypothetical protein